MNSDPVNIPAARSWREISQPVKARAMSRGGRWRLVLTGARTLGVALLMAAFAWVGWSVLTALQQNPRELPAVAKAVPLRAPELITTRDGVLDNAWLARTLEIPAGASLMELDLQRLQNRVLGDQQVLTASLTKRFPDRLLVQITERAPVARMRLGVGGGERDLLIARDGILFTGTGFDSAMLETLPWIDGFLPVPEGAAFRPVPEMDVVARLLANTQFMAPHIYRTWHALSLTRIEDGEIEVLSKQGVTALINTRAEFLQQIAKLDYILENVPPRQLLGAHIDLTLGRDVPVRLHHMLVVDTRPGAKQRPGQKVFAFSPQ